MILGDVCTRSCSFCAVSRGRPAAPSPDEPQRVAAAARQLGLKHVVITSVTRDDLADGGADHFYQCVTAVRAATGATIEVLTPDVSRYLPVVRYLPPEEFVELGQLARAMGFQHVSSGPFVRSSYHARDMATH